MQKSCVYIDGFNLYYGMKDKDWARYYWLDLEKLSDTFVEDPSTEVVEQVKYFTSHVSVGRKQTPRGRLEKIKRFISYLTKEASAPKPKMDASGKQKIYINALEAYCSKLEICKGDFAKRGRRCPKCGRSYQTYEEKKTDVNIACEMLMDAFQQKYNRIYIISGDSDLVPVVEALKEMAALKILPTHPKIIIANPPNRKNEELCLVANGNFSIKEKHLKNSQLPETVTGEKGAELTRPTTWA